MKEERERQEREGIKEEVRAEDFIKNDTEGDIDEFEIDDVPQT